MIDIHCHCLPGLDDGPESIDQALALCLKAADDGCREIVATPHQRLGRWWNCQPAHLESLRRSLEDNLEGKLEIHLGAEIRIDDAILDDLGAPDRSGILSLAGSRYLLLEYSRLGLTMDPEELVHELRIEGLRPIFAHPEFIPGLGDDLSLLRRLVEAGALFQVTAASVTGSFGRRARLLSERMIDEGVVHFVASDAHDVSRRPPGLAEAARVIEERWGATAARELTSLNASQVLANLPLDQKITDRQMARSPRP